MARTLFSFCVLIVACGAPPAPKTEASAPEPSRPADTEEPPADPNTDPLFIAAKRICSLVVHKDDATLAAAFVPEFFDTTPPPKLDATFHEVRGALGLCGESMIVVQRKSPLEGVVAVECEHGVLMLSIGLDASPHRPMVSLGIEPRPLLHLRDVEKRTAPK